jgi:hypothetical protein
LDDLALDEVACNICLSLDLGELGDEDGAEEGELGRG